VKVSKQHRRRIDLCSHRLRDASKRRISITTGHGCDQRANARKAPEQKLDHGADYQQARPLSTQSSLYIHLHLVELLISSPLHLQKYNLGCKAAYSRIGRSVFDRLLVARCQSFQRKRARRKRLVSLHTSVEPDCG
jgi:hypothetical protein